MSEVMDNKSKEECLSLFNLTEWHSFFFCINLCNISISEFNKTKKNKTSNPEWGEAIIWKRMWVGRRKTGDLKEVTL